MQKATDHVAIMFTDVVGYTAMMGKDEIKTLELVTQLKRVQNKIITDHDGIIVKELGDGILAYFNTSKSAIHGAIDTQLTVGKAFDARIRIGIHKAEVIFDQNDIFGDGVNVAARIEPLADPGGIYVTDEVVVDLDNDSTITHKFLGTAKLKNVTQPIKIYAITNEGLPEPSISRFNKLANPKKKFARIPTLLIFLSIIALAMLSINYFSNQAKVTQAIASLKDVKTLIDENWRDYSEAYYLIKELEKIIPENQLLKEYKRKTSVQINITTEPDQADVYFKLYNQPNAEWQWLGATPLDSVEVPVGALRWKFERQGYIPVLAADLSFSFADVTRLSRSSFIGNDIHRVLDKVEMLPEGMVRVIGDSLPYGFIPDFFIDKFEVSNREYLEFVKAGGYEKPEFWDQLIKDVGAAERANKVLETFVDQTGLPGPAVWSNGNYKVGEDLYPVAGVNWYEAYAYAKFIGKDLPTKDHWQLAQGITKKIIKMYQAGGNALFAPFSNFQSDGTVQVGTLEGITPFGVYDMGGNVREWCWNESKLGRWIKGGAWNDNPYMFNAASQSDPFDRSERNGFRCVLYESKSEIPESAFMWSEERLFFHKRQLPEPITEHEFNRFKEYYNYDIEPLSPTVEEIVSDNIDWKQEKVTFNAAYNKERVIAYFFLPKNASPPYQTIIYGPGSGVFMQRSSDQIEEYFEFSAFLDFYIKSGRAVVFPIVKESFERGSENSHILALTSEGHIYTDFMTKVVKDYRRCLDYMETRQDIEIDKVAFYGMSWGPMAGSYLAAVDKRIKVNLFYAGGLLAIGRPEANVAHFLPRISIPTLMVNGIYDSNFNIDYEIKNMFQLLGTPQSNKKLVLIKSDHLAPREDLVRETLAWLDKYFGPVELSSKIKL